MSYVLSHARNVANLVDLVLMSESYHNNGVITHSECSLTKLYSVHCNSREKIVEKTYFKVCLENSLRL